MKRVGMVFLLWLSFAVLCQASGLIIIHDSHGWPSPPHDRIVPPPRPIPPPHPPVWAPLEVSFSQISARIRDQVATTSIEQEFYNPNSRQLEGTFLFPVPKGAQINKFTMEINGKPVEAELLTAEKARGIYEDIVRKLKDPALLEYAGRDLFKVRIFPIEPHAKKRITLSYSQLLRSDGGLVNFVFPLNTEKYSAKPLKSVSLKIDLETKRPLKAIYSPSHQVEVKRHGANKATVGYEANHVKPETDFQLLFSQENDDLGLNLMTHKLTGEDGYFLLLASPGVNVKSTKIMPKNVTLVLDTSGSMAGAKLEQAKKALAFCVENLNDEDRFEILRFSTEVEALFEKLVDASAENRVRARSFIKELRPTGGTAIDDALRKALAARPEKSDRPYVVIFLTDGKPTVGVTVEDQIVNNVAKNNQTNTRIFCFGIGTDVNTHLLDRITEETKSYSTYVLPEEDIEVKVSNFYGKIKEPILANTKIVFPDGLRVTKTYPSPLPDLFKGEQLVLAGRYSGKGDGAIHIEGSVNGEAKRFSFDAKFSDESSEHDFIPRLWATRRVGYLLDEIRLHGESRELKDEVTELARKYSIVTPYTAYLIVEDEKQRGVAVHSRTLLVTNAVSLNELSYNYEMFRAKKDGDFGVGNARFAQTLKMAEAADGAVAQGFEDSLRGLQASAPARPAQITAGTAARLDRVQAVRERSNQYAQQSRFVAGRTFYQNNGQWVDATIQNLAQTNRVRVQFNSPQYFELVSKNSQASPWLALGQNLQVVLGNTIYEIYE